jgi:hypothetical protein
MTSAERCHYTTTNFSHDNNKICRSPLFQRTWQSPDLFVQLFCDSGGSLTTILRSLDSISGGMLFTVKGVSMPIRKPGAFLLASAFLVALSTGVAPAQDGAKQDMKAAGTDSKNAARNTGHAVSTGTKKATTRPPVEQRSPQTRRPMAPRPPTTRPKTA